MALRQLLVGAMITLLATSCATKALWQATDPEEHVSVPQSDVTEAELRERGVDYRNRRQALQHLRPRIRPDAHRIESGHTNSASAPRGPNSTRPPLISPMKANGKFFGAPSAAGS
jgi:hypothetical protein